MSLQLLSRGFPVPLPLPSSEQRTTGAPLSYKRPPPFSIHPTPPSPLLPSLPPSIPPIPSHSFAPSSGNGVLRLGTSCPTPSPTPTPTITCDTNFCYDPFLNRTTLNTGSAMGPYPSASKSFNLTTMGVSSFNISGNLWLDGLYAQSIQIVGKAGKPTILGTKLTASFCMHAFDWMGGG